ncbi:MAG: type II toxin-antitoxin system HicB family antitoxin [Oribacterium sp.]|jgi:predicted RNase H-like HicB family nuclease|nr:type II toxin-antitoxin system HicB family antitoxin [Oribacterium sp.]MDY6308270.1 type II toxin-antitoxin system HicB family antitoxin [Oribacterium sp.]MDY6317049.1 type II toxin-antitoxin system HicB family antitoxin [Oribacterium sp.]
MMKLTYPAIFTHFDDEDGYTVEFPDLPGCVTEGYGIADTMFMAEDAASGWILTELEDGKNPPKASDIHSFHAPTNGFLSMVALDMDAYAEKYGEKAVKKTLTIPAWMNTYVERHGISCSRVLREAVDDIIKKETETLLA